MKSKVILFSVMLICSKFVDSTPHSEDLVRQRAHPLSDRQVNQNAPNDQYLNTDFTQTRNKNTLRNSAIQQETTQNIYKNEGGYNYDSFGYDKNPASLPSEKELFVNLDSTTDGSRLKSYLPRLESYALRTSQVGSENHQYRNQNWKPLNQYANSAPSPVLIPDSEKLLATVQEPDRGPVQYLQPKYISSSNRRYYQEDGLGWLPTTEYEYPVTDNSGDNKYVVNPPPRFATSGPIPYDNYSEKQARTSEIKASPTRSQRYVQNFEPRSGTIYNEAPAVVPTDTLATQFSNIKYNSGDNKYVVNSQPRFRSNGPEPYDNYSEEQATKSEIKARPIGSRKFVQNFEPQSGIIYNKAPAVVATDTLTDQSKNVKYINNYRSRSDLSKTAPLTNYDDGSPVIAAPVNTKEAPTDITKYLLEKPVVHRYAKNYRSDSGRSDDSYKVVPVVTENVEVKSEKYEANYGSDYGVKIKDEEYFRAPVRTNTVLVNAANNKYEDSNVPQYRANSPTPINTNPSQSVHHLPSGIKEYNLHSNKNILAANKKRNVVVIHPNGTVEYVDSRNLDLHQNSKIRQVAGDGVLATQSLANVPNTRTYVPVDEYLFPKKNQPADEIYSNRFPQSDNFATDRNNVKLLPVYTKQLADDNISKTLVPFVNEPVDDGESKPLNQDVNQPDNDANSKPLPQHLRHLKLKPKRSYSSQPGDGNNSRLLPTYTNLPGDDTDLKSLLPYKIQPAHPNKSKHSYIHQSADDDNLKLVSSPRNQPRDDSNSESVPPYVNEQIYYNTPKSKHSHGVPADDAHSTPWPLDENQSEDDNYEKPLTLHEYDSENDKKSIYKRAYETQPARNDNNPLPPYKKQPEVDNSDPHLPYVNQPTQWNKSKSKHSHQLADGGDLKPLPLYVSQSTHDKKSLVILPIHELNLESSYKNQTSDDKNPEPLPLYVSQPANDEESKSLPSDEDQSERNNNSKSLLPYVNQPTDSNKSNHSYQPLEDANLKPLPLYVSQPANDEKSKPLSSDENQPEDDNDSKPLQTYEYQPGHDINKLTSKHSEESQPAGGSETLPSYENQPEDDNNSEPLLPYTNEPTYHTKPNPKQTLDVPVDNVNSKNPLPVYLSQPESDEESKPLPSDENQPEDDNDSNPLRTFENPSAHDENSHESKPVDDDNSKALLLDEDDGELKPLPPYENQPEDDNDSNPLRTFENPSAHDENSHESKPVDDDNSKPLLLDEDDGELKPLPPYENQPEDDNDSNPLRTFENPSAHDENSHESKPVDDDNSKPLLLDEDDGELKPLPPYENQPEDDNDSSPLRTFENRSANDKKSHGSKPADDDNSKPLLSDEDDDEFKPLGPYKNQPADDFNSKLTPPIASESDGPSTLMTLTLTALDYATSPEPQVTEMYENRHIHSKSTTYPDITAIPNNTSEDQSITLSPIEQATDSVSDIPPVATTSTTRPGKIPNTEDTIKDASSKQDDAQANSTSEDIASILNNVQTYSITTISRSNPASPTENIDDEKTVIETTIYKSNQTNDTTDVNQVNKGIQTGTHSDGPAESDVPITTPTSVQNDVNTGNNSFELGQSETAVIVTVRAANDTEDDIVTINIEVSESTDDADSDEKTLVVSIDIKNNSDDNSEANKTEDCEEQHNNDDSSDKNDETDVANPDPTMWIGTTDRDLIEKLIEENEKEVNVIYFFEIKDEPIIEREKEITKFCNGTVLIETKEITYAHKDDPSPTVVKTSKIIENEDYES